MRTMSSRSCATISTACGAVNHNCVTKSSDPAARPARRASLIATPKAEIPIGGGEYEDIGPALRRHRALGGRDRRWGIRTAIRANIQHGLLCDEHADRQG